MTQLSSSSCSKGLQSTGEGLAPVCQSSKNSIQWRQSVLKIWLVKSLWPGPGFRKKIHLVRWLQFLASVLLRSLVFHPVCISLCRPQVNVTTCIICLNCQMIACPVLFHLVLPALLAFLWQAFSTLLWLSWGVHLALAELYSHIPSCAYWKQVVLQNCHLSMVAETTVLFYAHWRVRQHWPQGYHVSA